MILSPQTSIKLFVSFHVSNLGPLNRDCQLLRTWIWGWSRTPIQTIIFINCLVSLPTSSTMAVLGGEHGLSAPTMSSQPVWLTPSHSLKKIKAVLNESQEPSIIKDYLVASQPEILMEAQDLAQKRGIPFRPGRLDLEYLLLTREHQAMCQLNCRFRKQYGKSPREEEGLVTTPRSQLPGAHTVRRYPHLG